MQTKQKLKLDLFLIEQQLKIESYVRRYITKLIKYTQNSPLNLTINKESLAGTKTHSIIRGQ